MPEVVPGETNTEAQDSDKLTEVKNLIIDSFDGLTPDVLFSFSGGIGRTNEDSMDRSLPFYVKGELGLVTGGRTRVIATSEIAKALPDLKIVTTSKNRFDDEIPTMASVENTELVARGVDENKLETEEESFSTITQLTEMVKKAVENNWTNVAIVINKYHLPRTQAMYDRLDALVDNSEFQEALKKFKEKTGQVRFICAEDVLSTTHYLFDEYMKRVKQTEAFKETIRAEEQGLRDLESGTYKVTSQSDKPK